GRNHAAQAVVSEGLLSVGGQLSEPVVGVGVFPGSGALSTWRVVEGAGSDAQELVSSVVLPVLTVDRDEVVRGVPLCRVVTGCVRPGGEPVAQVVLVPARACL